MLQAVSAIASSSMLCNVRDVCTLWELDAYKIGTQFSLAKRYFDFEQGSRSYGARFGRAVVVRPTE